MELLKIKSPVIIYRMLETGELCGFKNHRHKWLVSEDDLNTYIQGQKKKSISFRTNEEDRLIAMLKKDC